MFTDDIDSAFLGGFKVAQRVFGVGETAGETNGKERGVVVDDVGVGERSEVCGGALKTCQPKM